MPAERLSMCSASMRFTRPASTWLRARTSAKSSSTWLSVATPQRLMKAIEFADEPAQARPHIVSGAECSASAPCAILLVQRPVPSCRAAWVTKPFFDKSPLFRRRPRDRRLPPPACAVCVLSRMERPDQRTPLSRTMSALGESRHPSAGRGAAFDLGCSLIPVSPR
jgi:hypothetical protein